MKCIKRENLLPDDDEDFRREVSNLKKLNHRHIIKFIDFYVEPTFYYLIMEYVPGGELFTRIKQKEYYNERDARDIIYCILSAIKYCHDINIVHRDLKPENLLLATGTDDTNVKIADFGFSIVAESNDITSPVGTLSYVAPEILKCIPYGKPVDMWAIGVISYILLGGYPPFTDKNEDKLMDKIENGVFEFHIEHFKNVSDEAKDFIRMLLVVDMDLRMTAIEAIKHSWVC